MPDLLACAVSRPAVRRALLVVHTLTAGQRLADVVGVLHSDLRVQVLCTQAPSERGHGVGQFVAELGFPVLPWRYAISERHDVALAADYRGLHYLRAPVMVLPHGAGYSTLARHPRGASAAIRSPRGLDPESLLHEGRLVPAAIVLSHSEQRARLAAACPQAENVAVVAGDLSCDQLVASIRHRAASRAALGVAPWQRLAVVTSTWGLDSLFGRWAQLLPHLADQLGRLDVVVAALLHPLVWQGHGVGQVCRWLSGATENGLRLLGPGVDWRGVLAAADVVLGDHGSVCLYATMLDVPIVLVPTEASEVDPASPMAELLSAAYRLDVDGPLGRQVQDVLREHASGTYADIAARLTALPGQAAESLRGNIYRLMALPEPEHGARGPVATPVRLLGPVGRDFL